MMRRAGVAELVVAMVESEDCDPVVDVAEDPGVFMVTPGDDGTPIVGGGVVGIGVPEEQEEKERNRAREGGRKGEVDKEVEAKDIRVARTESKKEEGEVASGGNEFDNDRIHLGLSN